MTLHPIPLNFLINEENFSFFLSVREWRNRLATEPQFRDDKSFCPHPKHGDSVTIVVTPDVGSFTHRHTHTWHQGYTHGTRLHAHMVPGYIKCNHGLRTWNKVTVHTDTVHTVQGILTSIWAMEPGFIHMISPRLQIWSQVTQMGPVDMYRTPWYRENNRAWYRPSRT